MKGKGFTGKGTAQLLEEEGTDCRENNMDVFAGIDSSKDYIVSGYWQSIQYIEPVRKDLQRQFRISIKTGDEYRRALEDIQSCESIGVHVRRGDFVTLGWDKGIDYYQNALDAAGAMIPNARFFFFSDDREWVKEHFIAENYTPVNISEDYADVKEFDLLRHCRHQIISESTFGWWAAYLNEYRNKSVFIPFDCRGDIWNDGWRRIEYKK